MSAKLKKRLLKLENKAVKLENLQLKDVVCSICQSILIEPVTLPCNHFFCQRCFNGSIENNALCCPLCRLRIGSWLRTATKQKNLVNVKLWEYVKTKFSKEVDVKLKGEDVIFSEEKLLPPRLSAPGEIRSEYEAELKRLKADRLLQEQKHMQQTELLIKKIQQEEQEAQNKYLERLKQDEVLAKELVQQEQPVETIMVMKNAVRVNPARSRFKATKIDGYLSRGQIAPVPTISVPRNSPMLTDDSMSSESTSKTTLRCNSRASPEVVPSYGKVIKNLIDHKVKTGSHFWNKENGEIDKEKTNDKQEEAQPSHREIENKEEFKEKTKGVIKSLLVSLPLPQSGILQHKTNVPENKNSDSSNNLGKKNLDQHKIEINKHLEKQKTATCSNLETGSVDSMRLELCYFKPIEKTTSDKINKCVPLRVPSVRAVLESKEPLRQTPPSRAQYIEGLCQLRNISLSKNLPSAFVIAVNILRVKQGSARKHETRMTRKRPVPSITSALKTPPKKKTQKARQCIQVDGITKLNVETNLRRTRSMGSIAKDENETTPKKAKIPEKQVASERKPRLRSEKKKLDTKKRLHSPLLIPKTINNNKIDLAVKNLSSPLKNCDVKKILEEQLRIEKLIEQEKNDMELARKMDAEWNGRRQLRRAPAKRQVTLNYALRPPKKVKV